MHFSSHLYNLITFSVSKVVIINVNMFINSLISPSVQQTSQFTPLVLELSLKQSHIFKLLCMFAISSLFCLTLQLKPLLHIPNNIG